MAFRFSKRETLTKAFRRLCHERISSAEQSLNKPNRPERIHEVRKDIKKVRAILRLVRGSLSRKEFRQISRLLRKAACPTAALREAHVDMQTLRALLKRLEKHHDLQTLRRTQSHLRRRALKTTKRFVEKDHAARVKRILHHIAKAVDDICLPDSAWQTIGPGVKSAYSKGRQAFRAVRKDPSEESFHDWRERVKDLWYQLRLLRSIAPGKLDEMAGNLKALSEVLGDDHDLCRLHAFICEKCQGTGAQRELKLVEKLIKERQRELRASAIKLGRRFYSENPAIFCERIAGWWLAWHG